MEQDAKSKPFGSLEMAIKQLKKMVIAKKKEWSERLGRIEKIEDNIQKIRELDDKKKELMMETLELSREFTKVYKNEDEHDKKCKSGSLCTKKERLH